LPGCIALAACRSQLAAAGKVWYGEQQQQLCGERASIEQLPRRVHGGSHALWLRPEVANQHAPRPRAGHPRNSGGVVARSRREQLMHGSVSTLCAALVSAAPVCMGVPCLVATA
jgi:hypothetical protein